MTDNLVVVTFQPTIYLLIRILIIKSKELQFTDHVAKLLV